MPIRTKVILLALLAALPAFSACRSSRTPGAGAAGEGAPIRVLVVTGGHPYPTSFYSVFESLSGITWDHAPSNTEAFKSDVREKYDVIVLYDMSKDLDETGRRNLRAFLESGKGMVAMHHAIVNYAYTWPWWYETVIGGRYLERPADGLPASTYAHDETIRVRPVLRHPVTEGIGPFEVYDETYKGMWISPKVDVLLETDHPKADRPIAWVSPYDRSRVVYLQLGHGTPAHQHPSYRRLVGNAIRWVALR